jgi:hypothetical protein
VNKGEWEQSNLYPDDVNYRVDGHLVGWVTRRPASEYGAWVWESAPNPVIFDTFEEAKRYVEVCVAFEGGSP